MPSPSAAGATSPFQYAIVRVVPRIERGECVNAGVVLFCRPRRFLAAHIALDEARVREGSKKLEPELFQGRGDQYTKLDNAATLAAASVSVPTYFHVVVPVGTSQTAKDRLGRLVQSQVAVLNEAYTGRTGTQSSAATPFSFDLVDVDADVRGEVFGLGGAVVVEAGRHLVHGAHADGSGEHRLGRAVLHAADPAADRDDRDDRRVVL